MAFEYEFIHFSVSNFFKGGPWRQEPLNTPIATFIG